MGLRPWVLRPRRRRRRHQRPRLLQHRQAIAMPSLRLPRTIGATPTVKWGIAHPICAGATGSWCEVGCVLFYRGGVHSECTSSPSEVTTFHGPNNIIVHEPLSGSNSTVEFLR